VRTSSGLKEGVNNLLLVLAEDFRDGASRLTSWMAQQEADIFNSAWEE
jgi:hypothetical protein